MFSIYIEMYSLVIITIFLVNYFLHHDKQALAVKKSYMKLILSIFIIVIFNVLFIVTKENHIFKNIFLFCINVMAVFPPLLLLNYIRNKFEVKTCFSKQLDIFIIIFPILYFILVIFLYYFNQENYLTYILFISSIPLFVINLKLIIKPLHTDLDYKSIVSISAILICCIANLICIKVYLYSLAYNAAILLLYIYKSDINANTDSLTGVYNRRIFDHHLNHLSPPKNGYIVSYLIDVDNFKSVNDTYGHLFGDKILKDVATILKKSIYNDDYVIRIGGDEFVIIATLYNIEDSNIIIDKINKNMERYNKNSKTNYKLSLSVGYDVFTKQDKKFKNLIDKIDAKMYKNKNEKK